MNMKQHGFTLVELLITLAISGALIAGLGQILVRSKQTYRTQQTLSHMMEDGRYVLEALSRESRRIGFLRNKFASGSASTDVFVADNVVFGSAVNLSNGAFIGGAYAASGFNGNTYNVNQLVFRYQLNDAGELSSTAPDYAYSPCVRDIGLNTGENPATAIHVVTLYFYVGFDNALKTPVLYCKAKRETIENRDSR